VGGNDAARISLPNGREQLLLRHVHEQLVVEDQQAGPSLSRNPVDGRQQAARLKGKLLIIMGGLDENVVPGSTLQFVDALMKANKDFDLIYMPQESHGSGYGPYTARRICEFFVSHLQAEANPE